MQILQFLLFALWLFKGFLLKDIICMAHYRITLYDILIYYVHMIDYKVH